MMPNSTTPMPSGTNPPSRNFAEFAKRNTASNRPSRPNRAAATGVGQLQQSRATKNIASDVISMSAETASPYADASAELDRNAAASSPQPMQSSQLTNGT